MVWTQDGFETSSGKEMGRVKNTTNEEDSLICIVANFFDKNGKLIGQQSDIITGKLAAGETQGFETSNITCQLDADDIATYDVVAFPFQFQLSFG